MEQAALKGKPGIVTGLPWRIRVSNTRTGESTRPGCFETAAQPLRGPAPRLPLAPNRAAVCPRAVQSRVAAQQRVPETVVFIWKSYVFPLAFVLQ
jgi:hypothetical protein